MREALLQHFPQFAPHTTSAGGSSHIEIRVAHPTAGRELFVTTEGDEISIFFDLDHRHIGMCEHLPVEQQIAQAEGFLARLLSGRLPLVEDARWPGRLFFYDDPSAWGHDPEEKLTFTTWPTLTI